MNLAEIFAQGGIAMWPLLFLSILSLGTIIERVWFWSRILTRGGEVAGRVLEAARREWQAATEIARRSGRLPIGRFLYSALKLHMPEPEVFRLALETSANEELAAMRRGDKLLEAVIALSPLLGLLGTVVGLIDALGSIRLADLGTNSTAETSLGIGQALISTATGLIIAILSMAFYRLFQSLVLSQAKVFRQSGGELELIYRQVWPLLKDEKALGPGKPEETASQTEEAAKAESPSEDPATKDVEKDATAQDGKDASAESPS